MKIELFNHRIYEHIYITGDELIHRLAEVSKSNKPYAADGHLVFFRLPELFNRPIVTESSFDYDKYLSLITNIGPGGLFRIKLYTTLSTLRIIDISHWKPNQWSKENLDQNLEALKIFQSELTLKSMWNIIYDNPGKDWSKLYITLLS